MAAAVLISSEDENGRIYELAGDAGFTKAELATEVSRQSGKAVAYRNLPEHEYAEALESFGVPAEMAAILADCDVQTVYGALFDDSRTLSKLIGRPTMTLEAAVTQALAAPGTAA